MTQRKHTSLEAWITAIHINKAGYLRKKMTQTAHLTHFRNIHGLRHILFKDGIYSEKCFLPKTTLDPTDFHCMDKNSQNILQNIFSTGEKRCDVISGWNILFNNLSKTWGNFWVNLLVQLMDSQEESLSNHLKATNDILGFHSFCRIDCVAQTWCPSQA